MRALTGAPLPVFTRGTVYARGSITVNNVGVVEGYITEKCKLQVWSSMQKKVLQGQRWQKSMLGLA